MKKTIFLAILSLSLLIPGTADIAVAQSSNSVMCPIPPLDLRIGSTDASTNGNVTILQNILISKSFLVMPAGVTTGYFGNRTRAALAAYQASLGVYPSVGYFGQITRARLMSIMCGGINQNVSISSLSPSSGTISTQVTIYGSGFTSMGNTVNFGGGVIQNVSRNNGTSLSFSVPSSITPGCYYSSPRCYIATTITAPGTYPVSVTNGNGTSNSMSFTVTSSQSGSSPVISSVSAPTTLAVNQAGTWSVSATDPQNGQLTYSVNWGDNVNYGYGTSPSVNSSFQQSTSFTHSYSQASTYTQTFTVRNNSGNQAQTTTTVQVGSGGINSPSLSQVSPTSGPVNTQVTLYGSGFTATGNKINFSGGEYYNLSNLNSFNGAITFNIPESTDYACFHTKPQCYIASQTTAPGNHTISVTNSNGTSNSVNFNVTSSQASAVSLSQLSPSSGRVGTQVTIYGQGFTFSGNTINFGPGTLPGYNSNGNSLSFYVPSSVAAGCDNLYSNCTSFPIENGTYNVSVTNGNGDSNTLYFTVTN